MCRKQPTPTDILDNQNLTELDKIVFLYIRPRVRNSDGVCNFEQAGKQYRVELKRGQCIVKVAYLAELLQRDRKTIHKSLESLSKRYSEMDNKGMPYGCLITWLHYDSLVSMDNETDNRRTIEGQGRDNDGTANKIDKNEKNDNIVDRVKSNPQKTFSRFDEFRLHYPNKKAKAKALQLYERVVNDGVAEDTLVEGAKAYALATTGTEPKYIKHPTTWLNQGCRDDEITIDVEKVTQAYLQGKAGANDEEGRIANFKQFEEKYGKDVMKQVLANVNRDVGKFILTL